SSRRRHTISKRDWSSDVCSSDLTSFIISSVSGGNFEFLFPLFLILGRSPTKPFPYNSSASLYFFTQFLRLLPVTFNSTFSPFRYFVTISYFLFASSKSLSLASAIILFNLLLSLLLLLSVALI